MTEAQIAEARRLRAAGRSNMEIARCITGVGYRAVEDLLGPMPHTSAGFSPALQAWWYQQPWVWRPDNQTPIEAPWERISYERF